MCKTWWPDATEAVLTVTGCTHSNVGPIVRIPKIFKKNTVAVSFSCERWSGVVCWRVFAKRKQMWRTLRIDSLGCGLPHQSCPFKTFQVSSPLAFSGERQLPLVGLQSQQAGLPEGAEGAGLSEAEGFQGVENPQCCEKDWNLFGSMGRIYPWGIKVNAPKQDPWQVSGLDVMHLGTEGKRPSKKQTDVDFVQQDGLWADCLNEFL